MQPGARLQAAIDILTEIGDRGRPASVVLADWGRAHRFAGSADRGSIGNLVYDALRKQQSHAYAMRNDTPRSVALSVLARDWGLAFTDIEAMCTGQHFCPIPLTAEEEQGLKAPALLSEAPAWVQGDYPEWLQTSFGEAFGGADDEAIRQGQALSARAPIDLRVNTLKATRDKVLKALSRYEAAPTPYSSVGVRLPPRAGSARSPNVEADPAHGKGWFEVQDEASQIAAHFAKAEPGQQVLDMCAGAGGKTLALCAAMRNSGQVYAYDSDAVRFRPIFERLKRAGVRNVQTLQPGQPDALANLKDRMDLVVIDAPCTGTGVWRRKPDAKWRLSQAQLAERIESQTALLQNAAHLVKPGGRLAYFTCSVLPEENWQRVSAFLTANPHFQAVDTAAMIQPLLTKTPPSSVSSNRPGLLLTPAHHGTDGFYSAILQKTRS